jgi:aryl-alcohol dehydrogenase-like predicted oxidoreductase
MTFGHMADEATSLRILDKAFDAGVDFIDISEVYPVPPDPELAGRSEEICGKWLKSRPRDSVIVATKVAGPGGGWFQTPVRSGKTGLDRHHIERAVEGSLRRLGIEWIDLYQTHWPDPNVPIEDTLDALDRMVEEGKIRAVGCSNESAHGLMKSLWMADRNDTVRYETIQNNFSLLNRRFEDELAQVCRREGVRLLAYSPLAGGVLSGKYQGGTWPKGARFTRYRDGAPRTQAMTRRFVNERTLEATARLSEVARGCGLALTTFATSWTLSHDFIGSTLIGATDPKQLDETLKAGEVTLPGEVLEACNRIWRELPYPMG